MRRTLASGLLAGGFLVPLVQSNAVPTPRVWVIAPFAIGIPELTTVQPGPQRGVTYLRERTRQIRTYPSAATPEPRGTRVFRPAPPRD